LLRAQRPADKDIGIDDLFRHPVIVLKLQELELWKIKSQPFLNPGRGVPQLKAVVVNDKDFHVGFPASCAKVFLKIHSPAIFCSAAEGGHAPQDSFAGAASP